MKQLISIILALFFLGLTGCLETGYSYHMCNEGNRLWVPDINQGNYELVGIGGVVVQNYFVAKGPLTGTYLFMTMDENNFYMDKASLGQTCKMDGKIYLEMAVHEGSGQLGLLQMWANEKSWGLQLMEPNLIKVTQAEIPVKTVGEYSTYQVQKSIYNLHNVPNTTGDFKLNIDMFDASKAEHSFMYLRKKL